MTVKTRLSLIGCIIGASASFLFADGSLVKQPAEKPILVGIKIKVKEITLESSSRIRVEDMETRSESMLEAGSHRVSGQGRVIVDGYSRHKKIRLTPADPEVFLQVNGRGYRGSLIVKAADDKITVIDELSVDDYLKGVLPREVGVLWSQESLRAQAVASRTYLASHLGKHAGEGFDLCSDVDCQVYGGMLKEHPNTSEAVDFTHGEILTYDGKPIKAFFHSNCGGSTEKASRVWGIKDEPYLPRKKCGTGTGDPRYRWRVLLQDAEILRLLVKSTKVRGTQLKSIKVKLKSPSARAQFITVSTNEGPFVLSGNEFRIALNPEVIRSTLWTKMSKRKGAYLFEGRGWGHGIGLCQWGAKGMGEKGKTYRQILEFYYPHAALQRWNR